MNTKQVLVIRKNYPDENGGRKKVRTGKLCSQAAHAAQAFITLQLQDRIREYLETPTAAIYMEKIPFYVELNQEEMDWIMNSFVKITCAAQDENELETIAKNAEDNGLTVHRIIDNGTTEFNGVPTYTAISIGPNEVHRIDVVTGHLPLL